MLPNACLHLAGQGSGNTAGRLQHPVNLKRGNIINGLRRPAEDAENGGNHAGCKNDRRITVNLFLFPHYPFLQQRLQKRVVRK